MLRSELLEIISHGENSGVEFKRDDIRPEQLAKEIVALVNFQGGRILLGVEDDGVISGLTRVDSEEWVMNAIRDKIHPVILPYYEKIRIDEEKSVAVITFPQGNAKPYVVRDRGREEIFIRTGSTSIRVSREQQMRLFALGGLLHTELLPVSRTGLDCLDMARLDNYLRDIIRDPDMPENKEAWIQRLLGLGFMTEESGYLCCTIAGLLLFGTHPRRYLPQAGIRSFAFNSTDKEYQALFDEIFDAPLVGRWNMTAKGRVLVEPGLVEMFIDRIKPFISRESDEIDENFRRELSWLYPMEAIRELFVNALAHRDWTRFVEIEIGVYSNRLEVISPGTLPNSMTIEKMIAGQRSPRNPIIMEVLRDYRYVDYRGMGIRTKVIPLMKEHNGSMPEFVVTDDYLKTVFLNPS